MAVAPAAASTLADGIARALRAENFAVDGAADGEDGAHLGATELYDAAVLDLGLPKKDGVTVLREWRAGRRAIPVLILTARDAWSEKMAGFKAGADDYLTKPFRIEEVVMRLRALVRRARPSGRTGRATLTDRTEPYGAGTSTTLPAPPAIAAS